MKITTENKDETQKATTLVDLFGNPVLVPESHFNKFLEDFRKSDLKDDLVKYMTAMVDASLINNSHARKESALVAGFDANKAIFLEGARQVLEILKYISSND